MKKSNLKNIFSVIVWPILFVIGEFFVEYIFVAIFNYKEKGAMNNSEFINYINTLEYQNKLTDYINSKALVIAIITMIIFIPIFYKVFKKYKIDSKPKLSYIFISIILGVTISLIYNISLFNLNNIVHITNSFDKSTIPLLTQIICSGICGPILEEFLFRGIVYNKLKSFCKPMTAIILCSVIFGLFHIDIINAIYAFGVSFMFIYLYEKYKTLKAPIIMHISLNMTIILMFNVIVKDYILLNLFLVILSTVILIILKKFIKKDV